MSRPGDPLTDSQLTQAALDWFERLEAHLEAMRTGRSSAVQDIAVAVRALIGTTSRENDLILRFCRRRGVRPPDVLAKPGLKDRKDVIFAVGAMPHDKGLPQPLDSWRQQVCLISRDTRRRTYDWARFATDYANATGAHTGRTVPDVLNRIQAFGAAGMNLGHYMMLACGQAVLESLDQALVSAGEKAGPTVSRSRTLTKAEISELTLYETATPDGRGIYHEVEFRSEGEPAEILEVAGLVGVEYLRLHLTPNGLTASTDEFSFFMPGSSPP